MNDLPKPRFLGSLRSSPRKRRHIAWLLGSVIVVAAVAAVALMLPNTPGKHKTGVAHPPEGGAGRFWLVLSIILACFLLAIAFLMIRFVWRVAVGVDEAAGSGRRRWRKRRPKLEQAMRSSSE